MEHLEYLSKRFNVADVTAEDVFADDGWVYRNGEKRCKWFTPRDGWNHYWHPLAEQINRLEAVWYKLFLREEKYWAKKKKLIEEAYRVAPRAKEVTVASERSKYPEDGAILQARVEDPKEYGEWVEYNIHESPYGGLAFSDQRIQENIRDPIMPGFGQKLYRLNKQRPSWVYKVGRLLNEVLQKYIREHLDDDRLIASPRYLLTINGREWLYTGKKDGNRYLQLEQVANPRYPITHHTIMENIIHKKDLPPPPEEALDYRYKASSNDWWVKTDKGWYWYDNRSKEWKHAPHGPE